MRLLILMVSVPLASLATWWGVSSIAGGSGTQTQETFKVQRKTFKVTLQEKGELKASRSLDIKSEVSGRSTIIWLVPEGSSVKKGDLLVELASDDIEERVQSKKIEVTTAKATFESTKNQFEILQDQNKSNIRKAELNLELRELEFEKYVEGEWPQQLQDAELKVEEMKKLNIRAVNDLEYAKTLVDKKFITKSEYDLDEFNTYKAGVNLKKAHRDLEILEKYTHVRDFQQMQSDAAEAVKELERVKKEASSKESEKQANLEAREAELELKRQRLEKLEDEMAKSKIYAPTDGLVVYGGGSNRRFWGNDEGIKEGATVHERQTILQLPDTSEMKVVVRIHEAQTDKIRMGQKALIEAEGVRDRLFTGTITKIAVLADSQNRWLNPELKEYETEITLDGKNLMLKPGVTARVELLVAELENVVATPVQSVFSKGSKSFVFVGTPSNAEPVEVQLGLASTEFVEIKSGLEPGQHVLLQVPEQLKHKLPEVEIDDEQVVEGSKSAPSRRMTAGRRRGGGGQRGGRSSG